MRWGWGEHEGELVLIADISTDIFDFCVFSITNVAEYYAPANEITLHPEFPRWANPDRTPPPGNWTHGSYYNPATRKQIHGRRWVSKWEKTHETDDIIM